MFMKLRSVVVSGPPFSLIPYTFRSGNPSVKKYWRISLASGAAPKTSISALSNPSASLIFFKINDFAILYCKDTFSPHYSLRTSGPTDFAQVAILVLMKPPLFAISFIFSEIFSQTRGTEKKTVLH